MRLHILDQGFIETKDAVYLTEQGESEMVSVT